jgi:hypothetical protein
MFGVAEGAASDHGALGGLGDDDHPQYPEIDQIESITASWTFNTITSGFAGGKTTFNTITSGFAGGKTTLNALDNVTTQAITLINNNTPSWIFDSWAGATGTQYGFILRLNQAPTYAFAVTEAPVGNAGMRLDPDGKLWIAKGSPAYDWSGGLHEVPVLDIVETWTAGQIFEKDIQIGTGSETDDSSIFFTTDSHSEKFHWDYANARFELSDDLWVNGNLSFNAVTDTVAGIQNQNLTDKTAAEDVTGLWTMDQVNWPPMISGRYYDSSCRLGYVDGFGGMSLLADRLYGVPFMVPRLAAFDRVCIRVTTNDGGKLRLGIYDCGTDGNPDALVVDSGEHTIALAGGFEEVEVTISETLTAGMYFLAVVTDATTTCSAHSVTDMMCFFGYDTVTSANHENHIRSTHTYGALPDPFATSGLAYLNTNCPRILLRVA